MVDDGNRTLYEQVLDECAKYGLPNDFQTLLRHLDGNFKATLGSERAASEALREKVEYLQADLRRAIGCWENAMPQELFANNKANRDLYDSLARKVGMKPMRLGRTDAEYQALCDAWGVSS